MTQQQMNTSSRKEASKLGQFSWALFDWANQPFFTIITTFIFAPYFANVMVGDPIQGQAAWAFTQSTSGILIALMSPFLGAMADAGGPRKPYILTFQLLLVLGCISLWWAYPGRPDLIAPISAAVVIATIGAEMSIVFNNAQLPNIVRSERMGWLSGYGWGLGYCGGLVALFAVLLVSRPELFGLPERPDEPLFGLDAKTHQLERLMGPASALWLVVFVIPMFLFTPDSAKRDIPLLQAAREGGASLLHTVRRMGRFGNALRYLIAFMLYNDGLAAIIAFGGVYAAATFGWSTVTLGIFGIILTVFAIPGAFLGGRLDDKLGSKRVVQVAIVGVIVAAVGIVERQRRPGAVLHAGSRAVADPRPVRLAAGEGVHGLRAAAGHLHGPDAGGEPHHDRPAGARRHDRRVLRPVRALRPGDGVDGAARHRHHHGSDQLEPAGRGVRAVLPGARLRPALDSARRARQGLRRIS